MVAVTVVVVFSSFARTLGEGWTSRSQPAFFVFFLKVEIGDKLAHTNSTLYARISRQWLSELRRMWPSVPLTSCV